MSDAFVIMPNQIFNRVFGSAKVVYQKLIDWQDLISGLVKPIVRDGFTVVSDAPGLGIDSLN